MKNPYKGTVPYVHIIKENVGNRYAASLIPNLCIVWKCLAKFTAEVIPTEINYRYPLNWKLGEPPESI
jgi:hypothetical protein